MDIFGLISELKDCDCGREHTVDIKAVEIGRGLTFRCAEILSRNGFPRNLLIVSDEKSLAASGNVLSVLENGGFTFELKLYGDIRVADQTLVEEVSALSSSYGGILSVGSGSCNDVCRRAALLADKEFAIFATAPSMDGFASGTAPITHNNFKTTMPAKQPSVIIGDTDILAKAPLELKVAGFGDVIAKYVALTDWRVSALLTGEYYCQRIAQTVRDVLSRMVSLADKISENDPEAAGAVMEGLVLSGLLMKLADSVRPASGTEHIVSHFWEVKKLEQGILSDFHGRKVGVATVYVSDIYHKMISETPRFHSDKTDWNEVLEAYGEGFKEEIVRLNSPTVTELVSVKALEENWEKIRNIVKEELPDPKTLKQIMNTAGAALTYEDISVSRELCIKGLKYHPYMRYRMTLMRLLPMTDIDIDLDGVIE